MKTYRDYFIRCVDADVHLVLQLGQVLGVLNEDGEPTERAAVWYVLNGDGRYYPPNPDAVIDPETGEQTPPPEPLRDTEGSLYWHANLTTDFDLLAHAQALAEDHPELAGALTNLERFFPVDEEGKPRRPKNPACVRAGWSPASGSPA